MSGVLVFRVDAGAASGVVERRDVVLCQGVWELGKSLGPLASELRAIHPLSVFF